MDTARIAELYVPAGDRGRVGSGYRVGPDLVLTAAHVAAGLPLWPAGKPVPADAAPGACSVRPLGEQEWVPAVVAWRDEGNDVTLLRLGPKAPPLPEGSPSPRWGRVGGTEAVAVNAIGFPWAQDRPGQVRDTEQIFGFIAPASMEKEGVWAVTVLTSAPADRADGSPWAGMSGAALFAGPYLVAVVTTDPPRYGTDRVVARPVAPLLGDAELAGLLGVVDGHVAAVGPRLRLAVTADISVVLNPPYLPPTPRIERNRARMLLPDYGIVPFLGRDNELEALVAWCLNDSPPVLRMVIGVAGSGKTRLAAEACIRMAGRGWQAGFADPKTPGGQVGLEFDRATLLVVDDAELNVTLVANLIETVGKWPPGMPPFRLLLLARHTVGWWDSLDGHTDGLARELEDPPFELRDGELSIADRAEHYSLARTAFASLLPDAAIPAEPEPPVLTDPAFASPMLVHMHALLAASGVEIPTTSGEAVRELILRSILRREKTRWETTFPQGVLSGGASTHQQAVITTTLLVPPTEDATRQTMAIISEFAPDAAVGARAAVANWLRELYPGNDPPWVEPLRPDLLAEQLLASSVQLSELVLAGYRYASPRAPAQLEQLLTVLTQAGARASVRDALSKLLAAHLPDLLTATLAAPAGRLPDLLDLALVHCPQPGAAAALVAGLPERSTGLAALAATLSSQAVDHHRQLAADRPDALSPDLPAALNNLANRLGDVSRLDAALAASEEAVSRYQQLDAAQPGMFAADLAAALSNLANRLGDLDRHDDALAAIEKAVAGYRQLDSAQPGVFSAELATTVNNLANRLTELSRHQDARAAIEEAVRLRRDLAAAQPDAFAPDLATSLNNLYGVLAELGRHQDALAAIEEAVRLRRDLAAAQPDAFAPDLATSFSNLSGALAKLGRSEEALRATEEAVSRYRRLADARPVIFTPYLAMSLNDRSQLLTDLHRPEEALAAAGEAVSLYRQLAASRPRTFTPDLAMWLSNLAGRMAALDQWENALSAIKEAVSLYRQLAADQPGAHQTDLAVTLRNEASVLAALSRPEDAQAAEQEAAGLASQ